MAWNLNLGCSYLITTVTTVTNFSKSKQVEGVTKTSLNHITDYRFSGKLKAWAQAYYSAGYYIMGKNRSHLPLLSHNGVKLFLKEHSYFYVWLQKCTRPHRDEIPPRARFPINTLADESSSHSWRPYVE